MPHPIHVSVVPTGTPEAEIVSRTAAINFLRFTLPVPSDPTSTGNEQTDDLIDALIVGARELLEQHTWRCLAKRNFVQYMDSFPRGHSNSYGAVSGRVYERGDRRGRQGIKIWYPPLINCEQIIYVGLDGQEHTMVSGTDFQVDYASEPGRIYPLQSQSWPDTMYGVINAVRIPFTAGYEVQSSEEPAGQTDIEAVPEPEINQVENPSATAQVVSYSIGRTIPQPLATAVQQLVVHWFQDRNVVIAQAGAGGKYNALPWHIEQMVQAYRCFDHAMEMD